MDKFLAWLSTNPGLATALILSVVILIFMVILIYIVAFVQGREISFWPPKIGQKLEKRRSTGNPLSIRSDTNFFEIEQGEECLIVMNHYPESPGKMSHADVETLVEAVKLIYEFGGQVKVASFDKILEPPGEMVEFCIGGPDSNKRSQVHLDNFLKGVRFHVYSPGDPNSIALMTREEKFIYKKDEQIFALLAKIRPKINSRPTFLICGQTSIANKGALFYLEHNYQKVLEEKFHDKPFCVVIRISAPVTYGYKGAEFFKDITQIAFKSWVGVESRPQGEIAPIE